MTTNSSKVNNALYADSVSTMLLDNNPPSFSKFAQVPTNQAIFGQEVAHFYDQRNKKPALREVFANDKAAGAGKEEHYKHADQHADLREAFDAAVPNQAMLHEYKLLAGVTDAYNANMYINKNLRAETRRMDKLDRDSTRDVHKTRERTMQMNYAVEYNKFVTDIMKVTLFVTLSCLLLINLWNQDVIPRFLAVILIAVILAVYALAVILMFKTNAYRRQNRWSQFYWKATREIEDALRRDLEGSCS